MVGTVRTGLLFALVLIAAEGALLGQTNAGTEQVRALNNRLLQVRQELRSVSAAGSDSLRGQAGQLIAERARALESLIAQNASETLLMALPADVLADLRNAFPQSAAALESYGLWQGELEYEIADDFLTGRAIVTTHLRTISERIQVHFAGREPSGLKSGDIVQVSGVRAGDQVAVAEATVLGSVMEASACSTTGSQRTVTMLVNLPGYTLTGGVDAELVRGILHGNSYTSKTATPDRSVDDFWRANSDGKTSAPYSGSVVLGPYLLSRNYNTDAGGGTYCDYSGLMSEALTLADPSVYFPDYTRLVVVMPPNGACSWAGLSSLGCWSRSSADGSFAASQMWLRSDQMANRVSGVMLFTHELGHGLGMSHASSRAFTVGSDRVPLGPLADTGSLSEYGDYFSTMGNWNFGFYNAPHSAELLAWLAPTTNYTVVETSGVRSVEPYETRPFGAKALKIRRGTGNNAWLWVEYRQNLGIYDSALNPQVFTGALIHYEDSTTGNHTHLLDFTPGNDWNQVALAAGQSWQDPYTDLSLTITSATASALTVSVTYGPASCTQASPTVTVSPTNPTVFPGGTAVYTVSVINNDSAACGDGLFGLSSSLPSGWGSAFDSSSLTIPPGQMRTASMSKFVPQSATPGSYSVNATAAKGLYSGTGGAGATVSGVILPDLVIDSLSGPSTGQIGGMINVLATVRNQGLAAAGAFRLGFYYSTDSSITTSDLFGGLSCSFSSGLAAGASSTCGGSIGVPATLTPGAYYLGAIADDLGAVAELDEANNARSADTGPMNLQLLYPANVGIYRNGRWQLDVNGNGTVGKDFNFGVAGATPVTGDWNGDGKDEVGFFKDGLWYLDYNGDGAWDGGAADKMYAFGMAGAEPKVGDWNGDGKDEIGICINGFWFLDVNGNGIWDGEPTDKMIIWGFVGSTPVTGDWNGDGRTKVGLWKDGLWYLDVDGNGTWDGGTTDKMIVWGWTGTTPVHGDWNGDGKEEVGVYLNGFWYLDMDGNGTWDGGTTDKMIILGWTGTLPVIGDWNGDGKTKVGTLINGYWYLDYNGNAVWDGESTDRAYFFGQTGDTPIIGRW